jgi:uncharacterized damage-inducible protein DinB
MKKIVCGTFLICLWVLPAAAQMGQAAASKDPLATWLRDAFNRNGSYITRAAEKVPEDLYSLRPGPQMEVRTFAQILGHIANFNYYFCSNAKGEKNPNEGNDFEKVTSKAGLIKALNDALTYCNGAYAALTDASGMEVVQFPSENGKQTQQALRMSRLILNYAHNDEHYGNLVTYMRMKSIVPPSSEPRPQQR